MNGDDITNIIGETFGYDEENVPEYKLFDSYIDSIYSAFLEDTIKIAKTLDKSVKYLENGIEGIYKCKKLLNYTQLQAYCNNQKQILNDQPETGGILR